MSKKEIASRVPMMPRDTAGQGYIFGGVLLSLIDLAGATVARRACFSQEGKRFVTRAMDKIEFKKPVLVNDVVTCYGKVTHLGKTSVTVHVDVEVDRGGKTFRATSADLVFVAIDSNGRPAAINCTLDHPVKKPRRRPKQPAPQVVSGERILAMRRVMMPKEINGMGNIFGGELLSHMDLAGAFVARRSCANGFIDRVVTRFMDKVEFKQPVHVNDLLSCYGTITNIGTTSITVHIEVESERGGKIIPVTQADIVYVAVDEQGKAIPVVCKTKRKPSAKRAGKAGSQGGKRKNCT